MIFVDTSAWFEAACPEEKNYAVAKAWLDANPSPLITTDYVFDETLTLLKSKGHYIRALRFIDEVLSGELATLHVVTPKQFSAAIRVYQRFNDKDWSFTDCTSKVVMEDLNITTAFTFDHHFRQFGDITVVP